MGKWLQSGLRRDVCALVAARDDPTGQTLKTAIQRRYDQRIRPKTFRGALDELVRLGYLEREVDGVHDRYALTDEGEQALYEHYEWLREQLEDDR